MQKTYERLGAAAAAVLSVCVVLLTTTPVYELLVTNPTARGERLDLNRSCTPPYFIPGHPHFGGERRSKSRTHTHTTALFAVRTIQ